MLPLLLCVASADPDPAKALEDRMTRAIAAVERGVAAVVVSRRDYKDGMPSAERKWQLGEYTPPVFGFGFGRRNGRGGNQTAPDPLDLSAPAAAADNAFGSGLVLTADGLVLTTYHQIADASKIYVRLPGGGGSYADIQAADARSDLAVLKLIRPPPGMTPVRLAEVRIARGRRGEPPTVRKGQWVIAVGHPLAAGAVDGGPSASWGILSNLRRRLPTPAAGVPANRPLASYGILLQTDARVTLGGSGGGLFNLDGECVGLTNSTAGVTGAETAGGFALPFDPAVRRAVDALAAGREVEYGFLGVQMNVNDGQTGGVLLDKVTPGMPAQRAGLRGGDVLLAVDDHPLADTDDLFLHVGAAQAGAAVRLRYARGGVAQETTAVLAKQGHDQIKLASRKPPTAFGLQADWSSIALVELAMTADGLPADGVTVAEIEPGSPADDKLKPLGVTEKRWLVTAVDGRPTSTPSAFAALVADKPTVRLTLLDPGRPTEPQEVTLP